MSPFRTKDASGQMAVEMAAALPVMVIVVVIVAQMMVFLGDCAAFDTVARDAIRQQADEGANDSAGASQAKALIEDSLGLDHVSVQVTCEKTGPGHVRYVASMDYEFPLLRGVTVFGMQAPSLAHEVSLTVSPYRKGVVI